jgi:hypothetical protein
MICMVLLLRLSADRLETGLREKRLPRGRANEKRIVALQWVVTANSLKDGNVKQVEVRPVS